MSTAVNTYAMRDLRRAALQEGWLPESHGIDELDDLRRRHHEALKILRTAERQRQELNERHKKEDRDLQDAMVKVARDGKVPDPASLEDLERHEAETKAAQAVFVAASTAFDQVILEINAALREVALKADALIEERRAEAEEARRQAEEMVAAANERLGAVRRLDLWLDRAVPGRNHFPGAVKTPVAWSASPVPPAPYVPSDDAMRFAGLGMEV